MRFSGSWGAARNAATLLEFEATSNSGRASSDADQENARKFRMRSNPVKNLPSPLNQLRRKVMEKYVLEHLGESRMTSDSKGQFWSHVSLSAYELLWEGLPERTRAKLEEEECYEKEELISEAGGIAGLLAIADGCQPDEVKEEAVVSCWVETSMVSGCWSLNVVQTPKRGYVIADHGDWFDVDERYPVLGVWAPANHEQAMRECVAECYASNWIDCCLPPQMGEFAKGKQPLWLDCLERTVIEDPNAREMLPWTTGDEFYESEDEREAERTALERFRYVQRATKLPARRVLQAFAQAGVNIPDWLAAAVDPKSGGRVAIDESIVWDSNRPEKNPEILRVLLADYCYSLKKKSSMRE